jgi:hypothetical protein
MPQLQGARLNGCANLGSTRLRFSGSARGPAAFTGLGRPGELGQVGVLGFTQLGNVAALPLEIGSASRDFQHSRHTAGLLRYFELSLG